MAAASTSPSSSPFAVDRTPATAPLGQTVSVAPDPATGAKELGRLVKRAAARAISERGSFTLVLSGGSLVDALASSLDGDDGGDDGDDETSPPHDGSKWHAFWADERLVPGDSLDSNAAGARAFIAKVRKEGSEVLKVEVEVERLREFESEHGRRKKLTLFFLPSTIPSTIPGRHPRLQRPRPRRPARRVPSRGRQGVRGAAPRAAQGGPAYC